MCLNLTTTEHRLKRTPANTVGSRTQGVHTSYFCWHSRPVVTYLLTYLLWEHTVYEDNVHIPVKTFFVSLCRLDTAIRAANTA